VVAQISLPSENAPAAAAGPRTAGISVTLRNLRKLYGKDVLAVDIDELIIQPGEFVTVVGPSGCGKTSTLRLLAGLERPDGGEILFDDQVFNDVPIQKRNIAIVFQNYALYPNMRVRGNLEYGLKRHGVAKEERVARIERIAEMLSIHHLLERKPGQLSGGEQQRVALGRAIIREPGVLLLDEPLSNLDAKLRSHMRGELVKLHWRLGGTIIYVTHDQLEAMTMSDRIVVMRAGKVQQYDTPEIVYNVPANLFVAGFIGSPQMNFIEGEIRAENGRTTFVMPGGQLVLDGPIGEAVGKHRDDSGFTLGVRPEHLGVSLEGGNFPATVSLVELTGAEKNVTLESEAGVLIARMGADAPIAVGNRLFCTIRPEKAHLFERQSGNAVRICQTAAGSQTQLAPPAG